MTEPCACRPSNQFVSKKRKKKKNKNRSFVTPVPHVYCASKALHFDVSSASRSSVPRQRLRTSPPLNAAQSHVIKAPHEHHGGRGRICSVADVHTQRARTQPGPQRWRSRNCTGLSKSNKLLEERRDMAEGTRTSTTSLEHAGPEEGTDAASAGNGKPFIRMTRFAHNPHLRLLGLLSSSTLRRSRNGACGVNW